MKKSLLLAATALGLHSPMLAQAEPTIAELDQRVRALENTVQTMLELLEAQQNGASGTVADSVPLAEPAVPAGYQMGALYLDVFTRKFSRNEYSGMSRDPSDLPDAPEGVPAGSALVRAPAEFVYGGFAEETSLAQFRNADALVGVQWFGTFFVDQPGDHTFAISLNKEKEFGVFTCRSVLRVSDEVVADVLASYGGSPRAQIDTAQSTKTLERGAYNFSLWTNCLRQDDRAYEIIATTISLAAPGDRAPKPIPPEQLGVQP